ncbi:NAD(P)-dependent dehydrogenase, short-chain alcohol dehydrogenase family [Reichenbachiella agariperforans]|uniref:NAD(P)-dependent dehydrogenase, short-chain alcohol dehydrogenase family n=1 Tax=Reichenbachiella agariperforans TaxID=156994 RepID=A0A1M6L909_REIAG|nr:SDR family oxidoreductase [Reichenbachiella agariperforans]SHJ67691.1 NAD(P)-dependent dehydrogenase, short-chain alcohol dehydrogenase family [Reichenbachiella agariperforans]
MKKALITGANKGIGFGTARLLLQSGYYVYMGSRNLQNGVKAVEELKAEGWSNVEVIQMDITDESSVQKGREAIGKRTDVLDVLINNAGINGGNSPYTALEAKPDEYRAAFDTNVIGTARVTNAFVDLLRKSDEPRIVNLSTSVGSLTLQSDPNWPAYDYAKYAVYAASKAALNMYTIHLAYELRDTNFKVNAVCPGLTATDFTFGNGGDVETAAKRIVKYATIGEDGPTGKFFSEETNPETGEVAW